MISCQLLAKVDEALKAATGKNDLGGINVIFVGDFAQLAPVGETRLFGQIDTRAFSTMPKLQKSLMGQARWKAVNTVVLLTKLNRQAGQQNTRFGELLGRLRDGRCTREDYELLQTRVVGKNEFAVLDSSWADATVLVHENAKKDALNEKGAVAFAAATSQELHWYYAEDKCKSASLANRKDLRDYLHSLPSGKTDHLLGRLPLVIGMPVYIGSNFDVSSGITNGAYGVVKTIRYKTNEHGHRVLLSCVVTVDKVDGAPMPYLPEKDVPILPDSAYLTFQNPYDKGEQVKVTRTQLPLTPAFAMTAHKAQGQTLDRVIADIKGTKGVEAPYVMLSRVRNLQSLLIYGDFGIECITRSVSEEARREKERLNRLNLETLTKYGDQVLAAEANSLLIELRISRKRASDFAIECARNNLKSLVRRRPLEGRDAMDNPLPKRQRLTHMGTSHG